MVYGKINVGGKVKMKRLLSLIFMALLAVCTGILVSCSSPRTNEGVSNIQVTSIPYAFQDIINLGPAGSSEVEIILNSDFPAVPGKVAIYRINKSIVDDAGASDIAHRLGFEGEPAPLEPGAERMVYSYTEGSKLLEIYPDGRLRMHAMVGVADTPQDLPSSEECVAIARRCLESYGLYPAAVSRVETGVSQEISLIDTESGTVSEPVPISLYVSFFTDIEGYELFSPSASVIIGDGGKVLGISANSFSVKEYGFVSLMSADDALDILERYLSSTQAMPPESKQCLTNSRGFQKLIINRVSLEYFNPGTQFIQPIYVFEGMAYSDSYPDEGEEFIGRVDAIAR